MRGTGVHIMEYQMVLHQMEASFDLDASPPKRYIFDLVHDVGRWHCAQALAAIWYL